MELIQIEGQTLIKMTLSEALERTKVLWERHPNVSLQKLHEDDYHDLVAKFKEQPAAQQAAGQPEK